MINIILIVLTAVFAVLGLIVGAVKGFTKVKSWAVEMLLTGVISITVSNLWLKNLSSLMLSGVMSVGITVVLICVFMLLSEVFRKVLDKNISKRKQLSYYKQYDEIEDNTEQILKAIGSDDKKTYKKLSNRKFKQSGGGWSVTDKIIGAVVLAVKGAFIGIFLCSFVLMTVDFTRLAEAGGSLNGLFGETLSSGVWSFVKGYIFDFTVIGIVMICINSGYSNGITSTVWSLLVIALIVGAGFLSFKLAFNAEDFQPAAESLSNKLPEMFGTIGGFIGFSVLNMAQLVLGLIMFVIMIIAIVIIGIFVPKLIDKARDSKAFKEIDGVLGAIILTVFMLAVLLLFGAVVNSMHDLKFMGIFNAYFEKSGVATYIYDKNILNAVGLFTDFPLKNWLS